MWLKCDLEWKVGWKILWIIHDVDVGRALKCVKAQRSDSDLDSSRLRPIRGIVHAPNLSVIDQFALLLIIIQAKCMINSHATFNIALPRRLSCDPPPPRESSSTLIIAHQ